MIPNPLRRFSAASLAFGVLLGACGGDPRYEASQELTRLGEAMQQHSARYGRYPESIDPARPAAPTNLPHAAGHEVELRLVRASSDSYQATARRGSWFCWMSMGPERGTAPDCYPLSDSARAEPGAPAPPPPGLQPVPPTAHDSAAP